MKIVVLDLTGCKYLGEIHNRIKEAFNFPDWYGETWSSFWDLLRSDCDADKVIIKGEKDVPNELAGCLSKIHEILERNSKSCEGMQLSAFTYEIE